MTAKITPISSKTDATAAAAAATETPLFASFDEWAEYGFAQGWCGPAVCSTHDGIPTSLAEDIEAWGEDDEDDAGTGEYPCLHVIRLYEDDTVKAGVESNHGPSVWRQPRH
jgi:hypothetical protein